MTTVACRNGVMAADSRCTVGGWVMPHGHEKIKRLPDGRIAAFVGNPYLQNEFFSWLENSNQQPQPDLGDDSAILVMFHSNKLVKYVGKGSMIINHEFCAVGSGMAAALAAMMAGADARRAIEIASALDPDTGGDIIVMECSSMLAVA